MKHFFFDVGGTLLDPEPSVGEIYRKVLCEFGADVPSERLGPVFRRSFDTHVTQHGDQPLALGRDTESTHRLWRRLVETVFDQIDFRGDRDRCFRALFEAFESPEVWKVYPDVAPTLAAFQAAGIPCGIISNWDYRLPPLLKALGLWEPFDPILISCFEGVQKPSEALYRRALDHVGLSPESVGYVGDKWHLDLIPAESVGMRAFLIDRDRRHPADRRMVHSLQDLPRVWLETPSPL